MTALDRVGGALEVAGSGPIRNGMARCPAHDDSTPSLSVTYADSKVLLYCQAGCDLLAVLSALGLEQADLFDDEKTTTKSTIVGTYDYHDENGALTFQVCRMVPKSFRQRRPDGSGGWVWNLKGVRRLPYRLPEVIAAASSGRHVFIVEGEKDVESLRALGLVATCNPGGAGKWRDEYNLHLAGADVVILPDADDPGLKHGLAVETSLRKTNTAKSVVLLELPGLSGKQDVTDWLNAGHTAGELKELVRRAQVTPGSDEGALRPSDADVPSTAELLEAVKAVLERFVVFVNEQQAVAVAVWILHTHVFAAFDTTPYLHVSSATKQAGKSRLFEVLVLLAAGAWLVIEASEAALFRTIEKKAPTLLIDEIDAAFGKDAEMMQGIRGILNAGYRRGATVPRCVGNAFEVVDFAVYCPKAFAGIGDKLPDTVRDRSIPIMLRRRSANERQPERFRQARATAELAPLGAQLRAWGRAHIGSIGAIEPRLPSHLSDRQQDAWEPLFAIGELAGGDWPGRIERAAVMLHEAAEDGDVVVLLLTHVRDAFDALGDRLSSQQLLEHLVDRGDASPWAHWWGVDVERGDAYVKTAAQSLARKLHPMGIKPEKIRFGDKTRQGYKRSDFEDAWERYLPRGGCSDGSAGTSEHSRSGALFESDGSEGKSAPEQGCSDVPTKAPEKPEQGNAVHANGSSPPLESDPPEWRTYVFESASTAVSSTVAKTVTPKTTPAGPQPSPTLRACEECGRGVVGPNADGRWVHQYCDLQAVER